MRLCILTPFFNEYPNAMTSAVKMARAFSKTHDVQVISSQTYGAKAHEIWHGIHIHRLRALALPEPANYVFTWGLWRLLWKSHHNVDLYIVNKYMWPVSWATLLLKLLRKPVILTTDSFQGYDWWSWSRPINFIMWIYARTIGRIVLRSADCVVLFHELLENRARALGLRYRVIHNGVKPEEFMRIPPSPIIARNPQTIVITYIGRLDRIKGYRDVLQVAPQCITTHPLMHFYFVGNTAGREQLVEHYRNANIHFTGVRHDIPAILGATDIFVLPTYGDGLPNVIMEAMAAGVACIATNVNGIPVLIQDNNTGILIEPGDTEALYDAIMRLADDPTLRARLAAAGQQHVLQHFNWNTIVGEYERLFQELTSR